MFFKDKLKFSKVLVFLVLLVLFVMGCSSGDETDANAEDEAPVIHFYQNTGIMSSHPEGSTSAALEKVHDYLLEESGFDINVIVPPIGAEGERLNLMLGSKDDELDVFAGEWQDYYEHETIIPLNDLLDEYGQDILADWPEEAWATRTDGDGNIWAIPRNGPTTSYPIYVRQDWLDKLGLDMPEPIEELEDVLKAFREKDPNETGEEDVILMTKLNDLKMSFLGGFTEYGDSNWLDAEDDQIKPVELHPGFQDFLALMADWYEKGYIYREAFTDYDHIELVNTNRVGVSAMWHSAINLQQPNAQSTFPEMDYQVAEITGPEGVIQTVNTGGTNGIMITSKSENPEAVIQHFNWEHKDVNNHIAATHGIPEEDWDWVDDYNIELNQEEYIGEYVMAQSDINSAKFGVDDPSLKMHKEYILDSLDLSKGKLPFDADIVYNQGDIADNVPGMGDLERLREEEVVKFITGARSLDEYDNFIEEMYSAGLDDLIDEYTRQYNEFTE